MLEKTLKEKNIKREREREKGALEGISRDREVERERDRVYVFISYLRAVSSD